MLQQMPYVKLANLNRFGCEFGWMPYAIWIIWGYKEVYIQLLEAGKYKLIT